MNRFLSRIWTIFFIICANLVTAQSNPTENRKYLDLPFAELVYVPSGTFQTGNSRNEGVKSSEQPVHTVTISSFLSSQQSVVFAVNYLPQHFRSIVRFYAFFASNKY